MTEAAVSFREAGILHFGTAVYRLSSSRGVTPKLKEEKWIHSTGYVTTRCMKVPGLNGHIHLYSFLVKLSQQESSAKK